MNDNQNKHVILLILDGWGVAQPGPGNAISLSKTTNFNRLWASCPHTQLKASGEAVGLPRDEAGNTETGHLNLGAGKIVYQDLERINMSIADGTFFENIEIKNAIEHAKSNNSSIHLIGLLGAGGVHSNIDHLFALIRFLKNQNITNVFIHVITDGRDSPPTSSVTYVSRLRDELKREGIGEIVSVMGRYWAMDRDRRWDRTEKAYVALTEGRGLLVKTPEEAINLSYQEGKTDEFVEPSIIMNQDGKAKKLISDNDSVIFFNFRIDRPRQLTSAFIVNDFRDESLFLDFDPYLEKYEKTHIPSKVTNYQSVFKRNKLLKNLYFVTMTEYSRSLVEAGIHVAFPPEKLQNPLGRVISDAGLRQLRISESEKERFVTYYFNGQREDPFPGEERIIVPSPNVTTYDQKPEMSVNEITEKLIDRIKDTNEYAFILVNFANADMVGHTGNIGPTVLACETIDFCLGKIANFILAFGGYLIITADHGNAEEMINLRSGQIDTEHSTNPVPFLVVSKELLGKSQTIQSGILADLAPTILSLLNIPIPTSMTGRNLLERIN